MRTGLAVLALVLAAPPLRGDVVSLVNGDRVTGKVVGSITRRVRVQTPYGVLVIPADKVERIRRDDGSVEVLNVTPAPAPAPTPTPPPPPPILVLVPSGDTFWQAWDPKAAPADPSLRLEVRLDEGEIASYTDVNLDPEDLPKAVVNSFVFARERLFVRAAPGVAAAPPELAGGAGAAADGPRAEVVLRITLPAELAGRRRVRLAYQVNDASSAAPQWRDIVVAVGDLQTAAGTTSRLRLRQDRGTMEYAKRRMRNVETFRATLETEAPSP
jgi:hypothetical protein